MQNEDVKKFKSDMAKFGYEPVRQNGGSHIILKREVKITHTLSVPDGKDINGCIASRLRKTAQRFDEAVTQAIVIAKGE